MSPSSIIVNNITRKLRTLRRRGVKHILMRFSGIANVLPSRTNDGRNCSVVGSSLTSREKAQETRAEQGLCDTITTMRVVDLIGQKRRGEEHTPDEINFLVGNYARGTVPDYQMSAWLMAVLWRGLSEAETFALTGAMVHSGDVLDLSALPGVPVDKHSTGGVGDKTTLAVVPILASAGVPVAKMSGRGLGHTGGTLDKLESIPGLRTRLSIPEAVAQVEKVGACICAQTDRLVPADFKMYALRDATNTVESLPLIAASIMSKKIAGGSRAVVLDVKVGSGAFMKTLDEARALAHLMIKIGAAHEQRVVALLSSMDMPLGCAIGNQVEVQEIVGLLQNNPAAETRLRRLVCALAGAGFVVAGMTPTWDEGQALAARQIESGAAWRKFLEIVEAQGGDTAVLRDAARMPLPRVNWEVQATQSGFITHIDAQKVGLAAMHLGAGRAAKEDRINFAAGVVLRKTVGSQAAAGSVIATLRTSEEAAAREAAIDVQAAFTVSPIALPEEPLIYETLGL